MNKNIIVEKGGMDKLVNLSARFSDDPLVLQEVSTQLAAIKKKRKLWSNIEPHKFVAQQS